MFEKFSFTEAQIQQYFLSAKRDLDIAVQDDFPEVIFTFTYNALLKLAIAFCAQHGLRVKSRTGHHVELLKKLAEFLEDADIEIIGNEMRSKRNWDLYSGGGIISKKESQEYLELVQKIFEKTFK